MLNKSAEFNIMIGVNYIFLQSEKNFFNAAFFWNHNPKRYNHLNMCLDQF